MKSPENTGVKQALSSRHWKFLMIENCAGPMITNILINGGITWLVFRGAADGRVDAVSAEIDLIVTGFLLPFISVFIAHSATRKSLKNDKLAPLPTGYVSKLDKFPSGIFPRAMILGLFGAAVVAGPTVWMMHISGSEEMTIMSYVGFKAVWAPILAGLTAPVAGWLALLKYSRSQKRSTT